MFCRYLWAIDEVECQWQALVRSRPHLQHIELDWDKEITPDHMETMGTTSPQQPDLPWFAAVVFRGACRCNA